MFKKTEIEDFVKIVDSEIIAKKLPKGKTLSDFTGGYINILKNKTKVVLFFGYREDGKNKVEVSIDIDKSEEDIWLKVFQFKRNLMNRETNTVSLAELIVTRQVLDNQTKEEFIESKDDSIDSPFQ